MAWFLIVFGFALAVASFAIEAMAPLRNPWLGLLAGLILTVVGIVVLESRPDRVPRLSGCAAPHSREVGERGARPDDDVGLRAYNQVARTVCPLPTRGRSWPQRPGPALRSPNR